MRHRSRHTALPMRPRGERLEGQRRQPGEDQHVALPVGFAPLPGARIIGRDVPQRQRRRPQAEAEDDARRLRRGLGPDMGADGRAGGRRDRRHPARILRRRVLLGLGDGVGIAGGDDAEFVEHVNLGHRHFVRVSADMTGDPVGKGGTDAVAHFHRVAVDRHTSLGVDDHRAERTIGAGAVVLGGAGDAGPDKDARSRLCFASRAVAPERVGFQLVEDFRRANRNRIGIAGHGAPAGLERVAPAQFDRVERQRGGDLVDQRLQRSHGLQRAVAAHRPGGDAACVLGHGGHVDLRHVVHADGAGRPHDGNAPRIVGETTAVEHMVGGEGADAAARPVHADARAHGEGMALHAALKLLEAVVGEPHCPSGEEHRRQGHVQREGRVVASAKTAADIGKFRLDPRWPEVRLRLAEQDAKRLGRLERRLHAQHDVEHLAVGIVPGEACLRLQEHRIDGLGGELPLQRQHVGIVCLQLGADLLAKSRAPGIVPALRHRQRFPDRSARALGEARAHPARLDRRIDIGGIRRRPGDPGVAESGVVGPRLRARLLAESQQSVIAEGETRPIEGVEGLEQQERHRLAEIERCLALRAKEIAGIKGRHGDLGTGQIGSRDHHARGGGRLETIQREPLINVRRIVGPDQERVAGGAGPAGKVGGPKVRGVKLGSGDLGHAVDAADRRHGGARPGKRLMGKKRLWPAHQRTRRPQVGQSKRNATDSSHGEQLAPRQPHPAFS